MELRQGDIVAVLGAVESTDGMRLKLRLIDGTIIDNEVSIDRANAHLVQRAIYVEDAIIHKGRRFTMVSQLETNIAIVVDEGADRHDISNYKMVYLQDVVHAETCDVLKLVKADTHILPAPAGNPGSEGVRLPAPATVTPQADAPSAEAEQFEETGVKAAAAAPAEAVEPAEEPDASNTSAPAADEPNDAPAAAVQHEQVDAAESDTAVSASAADEGNGDEHIDTIDGFIMAPGVGSADAASGAAPAASEDANDAMQTMERFSRLYSTPQQADEAA